MVISEKQAEEFRKAEMKQGKGFMRKKILKIYITKEEMKIVKSYGCHKISYMKKSDEMPVKQCDFVIFTDEESEFLRNIWEISDKELEYTSLCPPNNKSQNFSLTVVVTLLYESIMHLRHGAAVRKRLLSKIKFPLEMVENELEMIRISVLLLEEKIGIEDYQKKLESCSQRLEDYSFESAVLILQKYGWNYIPDEKRIKAIEKIKAAACEMEACLRNSKRWEEIHKIAYKIHNEPEELY